MGSSPLGPYAPLAATIASLGVLGAYVVALLGQSVFNLTVAQLVPLNNLAWLAAGTLFGSAIALNGVKAQLKPEIDAAHLRLDGIGAPSAERSAENIRPGTAPL